MHPEPLDEFSAKALVTEIGNAQNTYTFAVESGTPPARLGDADYGPLSRPL